MTTQLSSTAPVVHEHNERLVRHVDRIPGVIDLMERGAIDEFRFALDETSDFLTDLLLPHMDAAERVVYPELERMLQNRHSTAPLRREHDSIRSAVDDVSRLRAVADQEPLSTNEKVALRRILYRLYALLKIHMAEELLYAELVEHGASPDAEEALAAAMAHGGTGRFE
ncbi:MAG: hemerythrin domain-containing protein [Chloroflexota bacterium]